MLFLAFNFKRKEEFWVAMCGDDSLSQYVPWRAFADDTAAEGQVDGRHKLVSNQFSEVVQTVIYTLVSNEYSMSLPMYSL